MLTGTVAVIKTDMNEIFLCECNSEYPLEAKHGKITKTVSVLCGRES